jgi:hypothetical protein
MSVQLSVWQQGGGEEAQMAAKPQGRSAALAAELEEARSDFLEALAGVSPQRSGGLVGEWGAQELVAHLGYWAGHAAEALHFAELGRTSEFGEDELDVDARNAVVARVARETDMETVQRREEAAFTALRDRLRAADPEWLDECVTYGDSLERVVRDDGADHYREHTQDLLQRKGEAGES